MRLRGTAPWVTSFRLGVVKRRHLQEIVSLEVSGNRALSCPRYQAGLEDWRRRGIQTLPQGDPVRSQKFKTEPLRCPRDKEKACLRERVVTPKVRLLLFWHKEEER